DALVEVHGDDDLKKAIASDAELIGINNRDLKTLEVHADRARQLIPRIPKGIPIVVESGLKSYEELMSYKSMGVHSFLVGTRIIKAADMVEAIEELLGKRKKSSRGETNYAQS
ncbi:MAG: indole-3-glycerol-phosphate synthase TrpC, partial [Candidatus Omnitrophica bacterium]|nr:indole-3-glycerol-phosphate synthase TrpC [Candidatus Omnitrophota bacterium]